MNIINVVIGVFVTVIAGLAAFYLVRLPITWCFITAGVCGGAAAVAVHLISQRERADAEARLAAH